MNAEDLTAHDEQCARLLADCDEALARGETPALPDDPQLPAEVRQRLQKALAGLRQLEDVWPRCPPAWLPQSLPGYDILGELGRGGMGIVYKARQIGLNRLVALKMVLNGGQAGTAELARFRVEAEASARLHHPNIVQVYDIGQWQGQPYFSLELIEGGTLADKLAGQPLPPREAARLIETLARAVQHAHQHGVIHRDLKPANVLLTADGEPKIADFGLAKCLEDDASRTRSGVLIGTPSYMAPEQAAGHAPSLTTAVDVYALGALLYEMLSGHPPFRGPSIVEVVRQVLDEEAEPPHRHQPNVPRDLETICLKCLAKRPEQRYASAQALADDLRCFLDGVPIQARPVSTWEHVGRWCRRKPALAASLVVVVFLLVVIAVGASVAALQLDQERRRAVVNGEEAEEARRQATEELWRASLAQARAARWSGRAGRRFEALEALDRAAAIRPTLELRNEIIACLALTDVSLIRTWDSPGQARIHGCACDRDLERYAISDAHGNVSLRRLADNGELRRLLGDGDPAWILQFSADGRYLAARSHRPGGGGERIRWWDLQRPLGADNPRVIVDASRWDFHPSEARLAVAMHNGNLLLLDAVTGKQIRSLGCCRSVDWLAYEPSGARLAVAAWMAGPEQKRLPAVRLLDAGTGQLLRSWSCPAPILKLSWRSDGRLLAASCRDYSVRVWNPADGSLNSQVSEARTITAEAVFNRAGDVLACAGWDGNLRLWEPWMGRELVRLPVAAAGPLQFRSDDRIVAGPFSPFQVGVWEVAAPLGYRTLLGHQGGRPNVWSVDFHPSDGRWLISAGDDGARLWDAATGRPLAHLPLQCCTCAAFHPDGRRLYTASAEGLKCWPVCLEKAGPSLGPARDLAAGLKPSALTFQGDGSAAVTTEDGGAALLRGEDLSLRRWLSAAAQLNVIARSPDGLWCAAGSWHGDGSRVWSVKGGPPVCSVPGDADLAFSPDGHWLAIGTHEEYRLWEVGSWRPGLRIAREAGAGPIGPLAFSPDGKTLALVPVARQLRLVDAASGRELATLMAPFPEHLVSLRFRADGGVLAAACGNHTVQLWDLTVIRSQLTARRLDWPTPRRLGD